MRLQLTSSVHLVSLEHRVPDATQLLSAADELGAIEALHAAGCTDGLPVIVPTPERVQRMVLATGMDGDMVLGEMGPSGGSATVEKVAIAAVMAGCLPDHVPVVIAAVSALCNDTLDTGEFQATTHCISPLLIVNGPAIEWCGVASGFGALGPGHRANATIGRAVRLAMINIGGARPGISDMALLGHPGKFTMCLAEDEQSSPWPPMHTSLGFTADQAVVTVVGTEGPHSVVSVSDADDPTSADRLIHSLAATVGNLGSNNAHFHRGTVAIALNPDHAGVLGAAGWSRADVQQRVWEASHRSRGELRALNPAFAGRGEDSDRLPSVPTPQDLLIFVAGGSGLYSMVFPSWGAGTHGNQFVSAQIELGQACEVPARPTAE
jgi:hypothetical protein